MEFDWVYNTLSLHRIALYRAQTKACLAGGKWHTRSFATIPSTLPSLVLVGHWTFRNSNQVYSKVNPILFKRAYSHVRVLRMTRLLSHSVKVRMKNYGLSCDTQKITAEILGSVKNFMIQQHGLLLWWPMKSECQTRALETLVQIPTQS